MLERLLARWRLWEQALEGMDDPQGDYHLDLEDRVCRLEGEVENFRRPLSADAASAVEPTSAQKDGMTGSRDADAGNQS